MMWAFSGVNGAMGLDWVRGVAWLVGGVHRVTLIFDISNVTVLVVSVVSHDLGAAVG